MCDDQDPLRLLPLEKWILLQDTFKLDWPRGISASAGLEIQRRWKEQDIDYDFKVYCPFNDVRNGMVAVNVKDTFYEIIIQCPSNDTEKLKEALEKTKVIDWNKEVTVPYVHRNVIECLEGIVQNMHLELDVHEFYETFVLEKAEFKDVSLPPNVTFGPVTMEHVDLVDSTWPNRYDTSLWHFQLLIKTKSGYGLFIDNALVCWVFMKEVGPLQHLYTVEEHRKKGYAELLLKLVSKVWVDDGKPMIAFCHKDNVGACKTYKKVGFAQSEQIAWCVLNKKVKY